MSLLRGYPSEGAVNAYELFLMDSDPLIRRTGIESLNIQDEKEKARLISPLLYDPVKAVRMEAASKLAGEPSKHLNPGQKKLFNRVLQEYIASMEYSGDFSFGRYNLGNLFNSLEKNEEAIDHYLAAIKIDNLFYPAKVNLAMLYNRLGDNDKSEVLFREVVEENPEFYEIYYSLALLLVEKNNYNEAEIFMGKAAGNLPEAARVHYNYGLLLQYNKKDSQAETELKKALNLEPENMDFLYALFDFYFKRSRFEQAREMAETMVKVNPDLPAARELLEAVLRYLR